MFGFKKKETEQEKARPSGPEKTTEILPGEEVTVQIFPAHLSGCVLDTAMDSHIGTRQYQQDAAYVSEALYEPGAAFGILCDGMGGMEDGERVSSDVVAFMANRIAALAEGEDIPAFFRAAVQDANDMVLADNAAAGKDSGTTLVAVYVRGQELYWVSVGDSRIYIFREGEMARLTRDHNFALRLDEMVDAGRITPEEAQADPNREALVSYIGAPVLEEMDLNPGQFLLQPGDTVLLCSDGLTKALDDETILTLVQNNRHDIREAAQTLTMAALASSPSALDNTSVILMQYLGAAQGSD